MWSPGGDCRGVFRVTISHNNHRGLPDGMFDNGPIWHWPQGGVVLQLGVVEAYACDLFEINIEQMTGNLSPSYVRSLLYEVRKNDVSWCRTYVVLFGAPLSSDSERDIEYGHVMILGRNSKLLFPLVLVVPKHIPGRTYVARQKI